MNNYNKEELTTIYFALCQRLHENKKEFGRTKQIELVDYIDYLKELLNKTEKLIELSKENN